MGKAKRKTTTPAKSQPRPWLRLDETKPLLYEKEAIYADQFGKLNSDGEGIEFEPYVATLDHWKESVDQFKANGVKIPLAKSHDGWDQTENGLGEVIGARRGLNDKGIESIFLQVLFDDEKSRDIGLKGDVSIESPPEFYDGKKNKYVYPIRHVASTNAPVIPGLESWQAIAASFGSTKSKGNTMDLDQLIELLGITVDDADNNDDAKTALIRAKIKELVGDEAAEGDDPKEKPADATPPHKPAAPGTPATPAVALSEKTKPSPLIVKTIRANREQQVAGLIEAGFISPATGKELTLSFCSDKAIGVELSEDGDGSQFDSMVRILKTNKPLAKSGRSASGLGDSEIELSHDVKANSFVDSCENKAKELTGAK